jgi:hypothetical protein
MRFVQPETPPRGDKVATYTGTAVYPVGTYLEDVVADRAPSALASLIINQRLPANGRCHGAWLKPGAGTAVPESWVPPRRNSVGESRSPS